jgi:predicted MPP superfamily phosphohydrolase
MRTFFDDVCLEYEEASSSVKNATQLLDDTDLADRLGAPHAMRRLLTERELEALEGRANSLQLLRLKTSQVLIRAALIATGQYSRGLRNASHVEVRRNHVLSARLPKPFCGFTILHLSDLHVDMSEAAMARVVSLVKSLEYDLCVITGDFRGETFGPFAHTLAQLAAITDALKGPIYGVLGNHDCAAMVPGLEKLGVRMLLNERVLIERGGGRIHLAGIDDTHLYQSGSITRASAGIPREDFSVLLAHTPEVYREAERSGFTVMLSGHTHGGQICLPGGIPITLDAKLPRHMGKGAWRYGRLHGYTSVGAGSSVVPVRFNCSPEITLHHLKAAH